MAIYVCIAFSIIVLCWCAVVIVTANYFHLSNLIVSSFESLDKPKDFRSFLKDYDWTRSTEENHKCDTACQNIGKYLEIRQNLDHSFHQIYSEQRQIFQDKILDTILGDPIIKDPISGQSCKNSSQPWIVFTAGCMGAGKSWTIRHLSQRGDFPLEAFIVIDPDEIRHRLPEYTKYVRILPDQAGELTRKEAGLLSEISTQVALQRGHNVLVDGSLRDWKWYQEYFARLRREYSSLRIAILHITAPSELVFARASNRARQTGRVIPHTTLEESMIQVPESIRRLSSLADFYAQLHNNADHPDIFLQKPDHLTWKAFRDNWTQFCGAWHPSRQQYRSKKMDMCSETNR
jgi:predicted kinase